MGALDYSGSQARLDGVKKDLTALAAKLQGAHLELITFDSTSNVIMPFTTDLTAFSTAVQGMTPQLSSYSQGSSIDAPISLITQELKNSKTTYPQRIRLLFYLGDGEQTAASAVQTFAPIAPYINGGGVLGYGTTTGAKVPNETDLGTTNSTQPYITTVDPATQTLTPAVSHTNPTALQAIASQLKVTYQDRNQGGSVDSLYNVSKAKLAVDRSQRIVHYLNLYWLFAVPFAGLIFWEWQALLVRLFELRQHRDAQQGGGHA
jgi:Ca-activated chloride channel family protein